MTHDAGHPSTDPMLQSPGLRLHSAPLPAADAWGDGGRALREVPFASLPGFRPLNLDLYLPRTRPAPVVIYIHGGAYLMGTRTHLPPILERADLFHRLPAEGIAVAPIEYRLSAEAQFPAQLHDVKAAIRWLRSRSSEVGIDPERIAVWGESAGGHLAAMATVTSGMPELEGAVGETSGSASVVAGIDWYGPTDFATIDLDAPEASVIRHGAAGSPWELLLGAPIAARPDLVAAANPCAYARFDTPPLLIQHGTHDRLVPFRQSVRLETALRAAGADVKLLAVPGADHVFDGAEDEAAVVDAAVGFLKRHLSGGTLRLS